MKVAYGALRRSFPGRKRKGMASEVKPFEVPLQCLYRGCPNEGLLLVFPSEGGYGITPAPG